MSRLGGGRTTTDARGRWVLPPAAGYGVATGVIALGFFASVAPTPLYRDYQVQWGFSSATLTAVYATYALGVLVALLLVGSVSDDVGRRPVLMVALAGLAVSTTIFLLASSTAWLFLARALGGLATGAAVSSASATLLDLQPHRDARVVAITNGVATNAGLGLAVLVVSALVQAGWAPTRSPFVAQLILLGAAGIGVYLMPEPVSGRRRPRLKPERPHVPVAARRPFVLAALGVISSWSIAGLYFSLGPQLGASLFDTDGAVVSSVGVVALLSTAALAQLVLGRSAPWRGASLGSGVLACGTLVVVVAVATTSGPFFLVGSTISGLGFGVAFLGGLRALVGAIPATSRAGVMSAFYVVAYTSLSVPAVLAGLVVDSVGLGATFEVFGIVAAVIAAGVAAEVWRTRPTER